MGKTSDSASPLVTALMSYDLINQPMLNKGIEVDHGYA
jgi:hypothetical protein